MPDPWQEGGSGTLPGGLPAPQALPPSYVQPTGTFGGSPATMAGQSPSTATGIPGLGGPTPYDPNNPQPYAPVTMPNVNPDVQSGLQPEQPIRDLGAASPAGRAAYIGDQLLRGYMQGKSIATARQAVQLARTQQGMSNLYNQASQQYLQLKQAGVDPNSPEMQQAQNQVQAAWDAQMNLWKNHIQGMKLDDQGNPVPQKKNLIQRMFDQQNPEDVPAAWYELMQKTGPPVFHQAAVYDSPAYQARAQAVAQQRGITAQTATTTAQTQQQQAQNQLRVQQLISQAAQPGGLTEDQQNELTTLQTGLAAGGKNAGEVLNFKAVPNAVPTLNQDSGRYEMPMINARGQTRMMPLPVGFVPSANMLKGVERAEMVNGQWMKFQVNGLGEKIDGTEMPLSMQGLNPQETVTTRTAPGPLGNETFTNTTIRKPVGTGVAAGAPQPTTFSQAISNREGFGTADSVPTKANNPGSLELGDIGHGTIPAANGQQITVFGSPQEGQAALDRQLNLIMSGASPKYPPTMTLEQFGQKYSGGDARYGADIAKSLGVSPTMTLGELAQRQGAGTGSMNAGAGAGSEVPSLNTLFPTGSVPRMYTAPLSKAVNTLTAASTAARIATDPNTATNGSAQYLLLTSLFHSAQGRSPNMTELTKIMGTAGWGATLEGWGTHLKNGTMSPELFNQIVQFAQTNKSAAAGELDDLVAQARKAQGGTRGGGGTQQTPPPSTGGFDWNANFHPAAAGAGAQ